MFSTRKQYNQIAVIIAGALLASVLIGLLLIRPAWGNLKALGKEIPTEQAKRDKAKTNVQNLEHAKKFFERRAAGCGNDQHRLAGAAVVARRSWSCWKTWPVRITS
ncbi:MAG: hypothetical protein WKG07_23805 [Hymenobacter sp.]